MQEITGSDDVAVIIEASHSCMTARGFKSLRQKTRTRTMRGKFESDTSLVTQLMGE